MSRTFLPSLTSGATRRPGDSDKLIGNQARGRTSVCFLTRKLIPVLLRSAGGAYFLTPTRAEDLPEGANRVGLAGNGRVHLSPFSLSPFNLLMFNLAARFIGAPPCFKDSEDAS